MQARRAASHRPGPQRPGKYVEIVSGNNPAVIKAFDLVQKDHLEDFRLRARPELCAKKLRRELTTSGDAADNPAMAAGVTDRLWVVSDIASAREAWEAANRGGLAI